MIHFSTILLLAAVATGVYVASNFVIFSAGIWFGFSLGYNDRRIHVAIITTMITVAAALRVTGII